MQEIDYEKTSKIFKRIIVVIVALIVLYQLIMLFGVSVTGCVKRIDREYYNTDYSYESENYSEEYMRERLETDYNISEKKIDEIISSPKDYACVYCTFEIRNSTVFKVNNLFLSFINLRHKGEIITPNEWEHYCWRTIEPHETYEEAVCFLIKNPQDISLMILKKHCRAVPSGFSAGHMAACLLHSDR